MVMDGCIYGNKGMFRVTPPLEFKSWRPFSNTRWRQRLRCRPWVRGRGLNEGIGGRVYHRHHDPRRVLPVLLYPRAVISNAACALGIPAIDTHYFGLLIDTEGLEREISRVKLLGFKGKMLTHPRHVDTVNRVFSPSDEEVVLSRRMVEGYKEAAAQGKGAAILDGKMIDYAMY